MRARLALFTALAWRNLWRNARRTLITFAAISVGVWSMLVLAALMQALTLNNGKASAQHAMERLRNELGDDIAREKGLTLFKPCRYSFIPCSALSKPPIVVPNKTPVRSAMPLVNG